MKLAPLNSLPAGGCLSVREATTHCQRCCDYRLRATIVNFHDPDALSGIHPGEDRRIKSRRQRRGYRRFFWIRRRQTRGGYFRGLAGVVLPIVVREDKDTV